MTRVVAEQYLCALARWGSYLSAAMTVICAVAGDVGWAMYFSVTAGGLLGGALGLEDNPPRDSLD